MSLPRLRVEPTARVPRRAEDGAELVEPLEVAVAGIAEGGSHPPRPPGDVAHDLTPAAEGEKPLSWRPVVPGGLEREAAAPEPPAPPEAPPPPPEPTTPVYIWVIIGIGAALVIAVIILIVRTRRVP